MRPLQYILNGHKLVPETGLHALVGVVLACRPAPPQSSDGDALDLDLPGGVGEAADDQGARGLTVAERLAARLAGNGDIAAIGQNSGDLDEVVKGHPGSLQLCFEILPSKAALLDDVVGDCAVHPLADLSADI